MTLKLLLTLNAILAATTGVGFLFIPAVLLPLYGLGADPSTLNVTRLLGGALLGYGALSWFVRDSPQGPALRGVVLGNVVGFSASVVGGLISQLAGTANALGWLTVAVDALFALGYGYFAFMNPAGR